jgi:polysaccharide chain length determinant protein (PEP-CTERM system associated)
MIENREYTLDDYFVLLRRQLRTALIPALLAPLAGYLISYAFPAKYTSQSMVLIKGQQVSEGMVQSFVTEDISQRVAAMQGQITGRGRLLPMVEHLGLANGGRTPDQAVSDIRNNLSIEPVIMDAGQLQSPTSSKKKVAPKPGTGVPAFSVNYSASTAREARDVCAELTSMLIEENVKSREQIAHGTTDFISSQLDDAKRSLDDQDAKLAEFKKQYSGQLPGDEDNNLKVLATLDSQLDANTQTINRGQQDKAYAETALAQQLSAWKSAQGSTNPQSLQQQLTNLQTQLLSLQARYTEDHPDVIKTKADIAEVKKKLAEMNAAAAQDSDAPTEKAGLAEPPEIRQLRLQVHQYTEVLAQASREQKRLSDQIRLYQSRVAVSPEVEAKYKQLTRDYDTAQKYYADLLTKRNSSETSQDMENRQLGEQMRLIYPASDPTDPSFPNRLLFAAGGLGAGLAVGLGLAFWFELRDKSIRDERDVEASLQMPVLVAIPWVTEEDHAQNGNGNGGGFWKRKKASGSSAREGVRL